MTNKEELNLSEKIEKIKFTYPTAGRKIEKDVKEFIKILKDDFHSKAKKGILILTDAYDIVDKHARKLLK